MAGIRSRRLLIAALAVALGITAGCATKPAAPQAQTAEQPTLAVLDTEKVVRAHPKYAAVQSLQREVNTLTSLAKAAKDANNSPAGPNTLAGLDEANGREYQARMAAKEQELKGQLDAASTQARQEMDKALAAYVQEVDKTYQPQIFNLQLKLKTVNLTKEEAAKLQQELEGLQGERGAKIAAKRQELAAQQDERLAAKQAELKGQLDNFGRQLNSEMSARMSAQQSLQAGRPDAQPADPAGNAAQEQALAAKRAELLALQESIIADVRDKTAKVATERKIDAVLADVQVNVRAVDITDAVLAEIKK